MPPLRSFFPPLSFLVCLLLSRHAAAQDLVYLKQDTREATRRASLAASGQAALASGWHLIGPFDNEGNRGFSAEYPPEREIDLSASYPGKGQQAVWREFDFADGQLHDLRRFDQSDNCVCYLYRRIDSPRPQQLPLSLGSDDGMVVWLNGQRLLAANVQRAGAPDQEFTTLDLKQGQNDLLLKITNVGGDWTFYFSPTVSERLLAKLERRLDRDFPPTGEGAHYRIETIPLPEGEVIEVGGLAFRPDGKLYVATRRGDVWLVDDPLAEDIDRIAWRPYLRGLHEVLGLTLVGQNDLYLVQRPEITLVRDTGGDEAADEFSTVCDEFGCSGDYHEYVFGPARDAEGNLFITLNVGFGGGHQAKVPFRGCCMKIAPDGTMVPWAYGLRSPNGVNIAPDGRLYYTDNQGEWVAACKMHEVRHGDFCGHAASVRWWPGMKEGDRPEMTPPAIWFPYSMSKSASEPVWDTTAGGFGPFAGQCFVGDQTNSLVMRVMLEEVGGRMQGACFYFRKDFQCGVNRLAFAPDGSLLVGETNRGWGSVGGRPFGLQRVVYTGQPPFEVHSMRITSEGWDLVFTQPVDPALAGDGKNYFLESYTYRHWETYGSPEIERRQNDISDIRVAPDGLTVSLAVRERQPRRVFHLQTRNVKSAAGAELLHADAYYTMNAKP